MEKNTSKPPRIGFHESSLVGLSRKDGELTLELEGVRVDENTRTATIRLMGVSTITREGRLIDDLASECVDGEILTLQYTEKTLHMIVECTDFKKHQSVTHSYTITCQSLEVEI